MVTVIEIAMAYFKARAFAKLTFAKTSGIVNMAKAVSFTQQDGRKNEDSKTLVLVKRDRAIICVICLELHLT